jgi:hypothetical protein
MTNKRRDLGEVIDSLWDTVLSSFDNIEAVEMPQKTPFPPKEQRREGSATPEPMPPTKSDREIKLTVKMKLPSLTDEEFTKFKEIISRINNSK